MGRLSQFFWFINMEELPPRKERAMIFTHLEPESEELKKIRREYRKQLRKAKKEGGDKL